MLLISRRKRWSCFVPLMLLSLTAGMLAVSVAQMRASLSAGGAVACLVALGFFLFVLGDVRFARDTGTLLSVRTLFGRRELDGATSVVSVVTMHAGRGGLRHEVCATDGAGFRAVLAELWSKGGAERACERLAVALESMNLNQERERLRAELAKVRAADDAMRDEARAQVQSYYTSGAHRRTLYLVAGVLVLYVVGTAVYVALSGAKL